MRLTTFVIVGCLSLSVPVCVHAAAATVPTSSQRFVVTLISSFDPIDESLVPTDLQGLKSYRTQNTVFGKTIYFVRAGFFASESEAYAAKDKLVSRFPGAFVTQIAPEEIASISKPATPATAHLPVPVTTPPAAVVPEKLYAITLVSKTNGTASPLAALPEKLSGQQLYTRESISGGKTTSTLNLGFFTSTDEAENARKLLSKTYPNAKVRTASIEERDASVNSEVAYSEPPTPKASKTNAPAVAATAAIVGTAATAGTAATTATTTTAGTAAKAGSAATTATATTATAATATAATAATGTVATTATATAGTTATAKAGAAATTATTATASTAESSATAVTAAPTDKPVPNNPIDKQAAELMAKARAALERKDNDTAVQALDQLLKLPPNQQSQEAQELVGLARERMGQIPLARQEYNLYLKLYPTGEGADRVRQRLANIDFIPPKQQLAATKPRGPAPVTTVYGNLSQYYYRGDSQIDSTSVPTVGPVVVNPTLSATNQSTLISNLYMTGRMRSGEWDNRVVIRDTYISDFLANNNSSFTSTINPNRLYDAYFEIRNKADDYGGRLGRQPATPGVWGRFDGMFLNYGLTPKWQLNVSAGKPYELNPINSEKQFWSTFVTYGTFAEHWNGNLYFVQQTIDGILDRQAVGNELRFFDPKGSAVLLLDYDISYSKLNIVSLQSTWLASPDTSFNLLLDHRYAPPIATSNALIGALDTSMSSQLQTRTESELRAQALAQSAMANTYQLGGSHNFNQTWQMSGNITLFNMSGTSANTISQGVSATGNTLVYNLQGILLTSKRDTTVLSLNYLTGPTSDGTSVTLSNHTSLTDRWLLDLALSYYQGTTSTITSDTTRLSPRVRLAYRLRDNLTFEAEASLEKTTSNTTTTNTVTNITTTDTQNTDYHYFSIGYRWDF
jgi:tetratricopeptide (TPR) repeat protein